MIFACDDCWQLRPDTSSAGMKIVLAAVAMSIVALGLVAAFRAWRSGGSRRTGYAGLAVASLVLAGAAVPLLVPVNPTIAGAQPRVFCGVAAMEGRNEVLARVDALGSGPAAVEACRQGFADQRRLSLTLVGLAVFVAAGSLVAARGRGQGRRPAVPATA